MGFAGDLIAQHAEAWRDSVRAPFLDRCKDGSVDPRDFETWLIQVSVQCGRMGCEKACAQLGTEIRS